MSKADPPKLLADAMLGTLARRLRMLGIDTLYLRDAGDGELKYLVRSQNRILLTKDSRLARDLPGNTWLVKGADVRDEFLSIAERLAPFSEQVKPFSRCLECNALFEPVDRLHVRGKVPPYVLKTCETFVRCPDCGKVFWEGTHGSRMREEIGWMQGVLEKEKRRRGEEERPGD